MAEQCVIADAIDKRIAARIRQFLDVYNSVDERIILKEIAFLKQFFNKKKKGSHDLT